MLGLVARLVFVGVYERPEFVEEPRFRTVLSQLSAGLDSLLGEEIPVEIREVIPKRVKDHWAKYAGTIVTLIINL